MPASSISHRGKNTHRSFLYQVDFFAGWWRLSQVADDEKMTNIVPLVFLPSERECEELARHLVDKNNAERNREKRAREKPYVPTGGKRGGSRGGNTKFCFSKEGKS